MRSYSRCCVHAAAALTHSNSLSDLLARLEPGADVLGTDGSVFAGGVAVRSQDDPGRKVLLLVPAEVPAARADGEARWLRDHRSALESLFKAHRTSLATVVFAGDWPGKQHRERVGRTSVRIVSAAHHLWADRLRLHDEAGNVDEKARRAFLQRLGARWTDEEERLYTDAALREVDDGSAEAKETRESLVRNRPDLISGKVTVIYGAGGIGKTFFLRRVTDRFTRIAMSDRCVGIPVFAELPLLLHTDALETWLSHRGVRMRLEQIRALISTGVIVPILDALDELVRGQAREGSRAFLEQLAATAGGNGRIVLSSRDYYLNLDPLVREGLGRSQPVELTVGYFTKSGRRRYIQMRTGLNESAASKWAGQLEEQAVEALAGLTDEDLESLIGHPLFLDAFCRIILDIPAAERAASVGTFRIASPNVFGEIVQKVFEREEGKVQPGWNAKFADDLEGDWQAPFTPAWQQKILRELVLLVARDGAVETYRRSLEDDRYRELYHGLFTFTRGIAAADNANRKELLAGLVRRILGEPQVSDHVPEGEREVRRQHALDEYAGFLLQHTLSDTRPNLVEELIFATRHRAYFDYMLADALLDALRSTLLQPDEPSREHFIDWCLAHHIFETEGSTEAEPPFASCLDFVLWHREALDQTARLLVDYFGSPEVDDVLGSYVFSLGLAVLLRSGQHSGGARLVDTVIAAHGPSDLELLENIVPAVTSLRVAGCTFGRIRIGESRLRDVHVETSGFAGLELRHTHGIRLTFDECESSELRLAGSIHLADCILDIDVPSDGIKLEALTQLTLERSQLSSELFAHLEQAQQLRPDVIRLDRCMPIVHEEELRWSRGHFFVSKLMSLARRHGHAEYAVYVMKLRGLSGATPENFGAALDVLRRFGVIEMMNEMVCLTEAARENRFSGKLRPGLPTYTDVAGYWAPIVAELDRVLTR